jgi:hypothetical protein
MELEKEEEEVKVEEGKEERGREEEEGWKADLKAKGLGAGPPGEPAEDPLGCTP